MNRIASALVLVAVGLVARPAMASGPAYSPAFESCMGASGGVTLAMIDCIGEEFTAQDRRLNTVYQQALAALPAPRRAAFARAQRAWVAFKEAECDFVLDPDGGSLARIAANDCMLRMTATRADELEAVLADAGAH